MITPRNSGTESFRINTQISPETADFISSSANAMEKLRGLQPELEAVLGTLVKTLRDNYLVQQATFDRLYGTTLLSNDIIYDEQTTSDVRDGIQNILNQLNPNHRDGKIGTTKEWGDTSPNPLVYHRPSDNCGGQSVFKEVDFSPYIESRRFQHPELIGKWVMRVGEIFPDTQQFVATSQHRASETPRNGRHTDDASAIAFSALVSYADDRPRMGIIVIDNEATDCRSSAHSELMRLHAQYRLPQSPPVKT